MDDTSDSCLEAATAEKSGTEQTPASSERLVREAKNGHPEEKPLLSEATGTVQYTGCREEDWKEQSSLEHSRMEQKLPSSAQCESPCKGLGNEVTRNNGHDALEPDASFSASSESMSLVTNDNDPTLLETRDSAREGQTSQHSVLSEDMANGRGTGSMIEDAEALRRARADSDETIQSEKLYLDQEDFPGKAVQQDYHMPDVITVRVQRDSASFQDVVVKIERPTYHKPFLGGFKNRITGVEFHNAGSQTIPKTPPDKGIQVFCRETQAFFEKNKPQQTKNTTSTQMTKIGLYVSNTTDKIIRPGKYLTAEEYHKRRLEAVIVLQTYFRRWHAINVVQNLRELRRLRLAWEAQKELQRKQAKEEKLRRGYARRLNPKTKEDFELLYHAVELWRQEETEKINRSLTGAERKAALCGLLEQEAQLIASIGRHKLNADEENRQKAILHFLDKEHECKLTQEIVELIDREVDLMSREVKEHNLEGLRRRICTLFLQYTKNPKFNPEVARMLKVPRDPLKLYKTVHFCQSCKNHLMSTEFPVSARSRTIGRCRLCYKLDNEAQQRETFLKYKLILESLRKSEADYQDDAKIVFSIQHQDLQYLIETIWGCQSALSACSDLYDLIMVRWDKQYEWSPWNTILLTEDEADAHLKMCNLEEAYEATFIDGIKSKHNQAKTYFAQFPALASFLQRSDNEANANEFLIAAPIPPVTQP
ncbi:IQ motif and ubiquitin-like domain-containing protein isoform X2 [Melanerpes formicivorus]|uniref:IQ motif and ubiquitin-like domain-containing protein isoform X2 n=1 Tax=Melanerpes formicivorus TaxID=211600 RepID=UPI00358E0669